MPELPIPDDFIAWAIARDPQLLDPDTGRPDMRAIGEQVNDILRGHMLREEEAYA